MTLYDHIITMSVAKNHPIEFTPEDAYIMYQWTVPVFNCVIDTLNSRLKDSAFKDIDTKKIPQETYNTLAFLTKLKGRVSYDPMYFNVDELKLFVGIIEGCEYCAKFQDCPYLKVHYTEHNYYQLSTFTPSENIEKRRNKLMKKIKKIIKEHEV